MGGSAIVVMGALSGCSSTTKEEPKTTSTPSSSAATSGPAVSSTEKSVNGGVGSFSPTIKPDMPGDACNKVINGVCQRG